MTDDYPNPKEALLGNGHVANAYCAAKWAIWQFFHLLVAVTALVFVIPPAHVVKWIGKRPPTTILIVAGALNRALDYIIESRGGRAVGKAVFYSLIVIFGAVVVPFIALDNVYRGSRLQAWLNRGQTTAKQTPGVRRLYGDCPVSLSLEPKWFERFVKRFEPEL